ncbi:MAG: hypothetical protein GX330_06595 [Bacteroidales bacterium]|nr:hypothetical protein [Bacteroidales bacterium]
MGKKIKILLTTTIVALTFTATAQWEGPKYGEDSVSCITKISLYRESYRQKNYKEAYPNWKWVLDNCPMSSKNVFLNGPLILDNLIKNEKDSALKATYIQNIFDMYELYIKCYPSEESYALGHTAVNLMRYKAYEWENAYETFNKAFDLGGKNMPPQVLDVFFITAERYMNNKGLTSEVMIDAYDKITEVLDEKLDESEIAFEKSMRKIYDLQEKLENELVSQDEYDVLYEDYSRDSARSANVFAMYQRVEKNMELRFSKYAKCEDLVAIYGKKIETNKDERILNQILKFFGKEKCIDNDVYRTAVEELHKIKPTARTAFAMANICFYIRNTYQDAINYCKEAIDLYEKESDKIRAYYIMAESHKHLGQYSAAREIAHNILKLNPNEANAYVLIGDLYYASAGVCSSLELPTAVYWASADKYSRAMNMTAAQDDEIKQKIYKEAQAKLSNVAKYFPKIETYFQLGLQKGQSYRVECWIGETTTVR